VWPVDILVAFADFLEDSFSANTSRMLFGEMHGKFVAVVENRGTPTASD